MLLSVKALPPILFEASKHITFLPDLIKCSVAESPAAPAPIIITS